jgi:hypothetical protein
MTAKQIEEFHKLEMAYLDSVIAGDGGKQLEMMELIFFWLLKQMRVAQSFLIVLGSPYDVKELAHVTEIQKQEFTFLQMAMIKAVGRDDRESMVQIELKMREWVDIQITAAVNKIMKPEFKITRKS